MVEELKKRFDDRRGIARALAGLALWALNVAAALDQVVNAALGGHPAHTLSRRFGAWLTSSSPERRRLARFICRALSRHGTAHCEGYPRTEYDWGGRRCRALWE